MNYLRQVWKFLSFLFLSLLIFILIDIVVIAVSLGFSYFADWWWILTTGWLFMFILWQVKDRMIGDTITWLIGKAPNVKIGGVIIIIVSAGNLVRTLISFWTTDLENKSFLLPITMTIIMLFITWEAIDSAVFSLRGEEKEYDDGFNI